jgi:hypothetical protein
MLGIRPSCPARPCISVLLVIGLSACGSGTGDDGLSESAGAAGAPSSGGSTGGSAPTGGMPSAQGGEPGAAGAPSTGGSTGGSAPTGGTGGTPTCTDVPPDTTYTCAQQVGWGKCGESFMQGFCDASCGRCATGTGGAPGTGGASGTGGSGPATCASVGGGECPATVTCPGTMWCGCVIVSGLGVNKQALLTAGASEYMLASAMMETERMDTSYPYGDNKWGNGFNAGVCKQNWYMMRACHPAWRGLGEADYATAAVLNTDRVLDVQVYDECRAYYGDLWWAGHRNGITGLDYPNTGDIAGFRAAMDWTAQMIVGHECDDVRFWVNVSPI